VLMENGLVAALGGILGIAPVSIAVVLFNRQAGVSFGVGAPVSIAVVAGVMLLTLATTLIVAWGAVRVRPLEILRYE
jgi:putative ABC transport system permease protein